MYTEEQLVSIGEGKFLPINIAAQYVYTSDRTLRRECTRKNIEHLRYKNQLYFNSFYFKKYLFIVIYAYCHILGYISH